MGGKGRIGVQNILTCSGVVGPNIQAQYMGALVTHDLMPIVI